MTTLRTLLAALLGSMARDEGQVERAVQALQQPAKEVDEQYQFLGGMW